MGILKYHLMDIGFWTCSSPSLERHPAFPGSFSAHVVDTSEDFKSQQHWSWLHWRGQLELLQPQQGQVMKWPSWCVHCGTLCDINHTVPSSLSLQGKTAVFTNKSQWHSDFRAGIYYSNWIVHSWYIFINGLWFKVWFSARKRLLKNSSVLRVQVLMSAKKQKSCH